MTVFVQTAVESPLSHRRQQKLTLWHAVLLLVMLLPVAAQASIFDKLMGADDKPLPVEQAYSFSAEPLVTEDQAAGALAEGNYTLNWTITDNYYLYRDKIKLILPENVVVADKQYSPSKAKDDPLFGQVQVYYEQAQVLVSLQRMPGSAPLATEVPITVEYQGCWEGGICYPPVRQTFMVEQLPEAGRTPVKLAEAQAPAGQFSSLSLTDQRQVTAVLASGDWWLILTLFFVAGLALSLTPCVFPMVPILAGVIAGAQGAKTPHYQAGQPPQYTSHGTASKGFWLSLVYVLSMAVTYTLAGVFAGLFGENLQILFQTPAVIIFISLLFVVFALAMFGFVQLQVPHIIQDKLSWAYRSQQGGRVLGVAVMGFLSALIVGPCVAAPLAGALIFIGQSGDPVLGGAALFVLSLGMGIPLILVGTSAGKWLPRAGAWMNTVKSAFGVVMLLMAIWMLDRIISTPLTMLLVGVVLVVTAIYLRVLDALPSAAGKAQRFGKALGVLLLVYGLALLIGAAGGGRSLVYPLQGYVVGAGQAAVQPLEFTTVESYAELEPILRSATEERQPVMLDFYADWCVSCVELEHYTFADPLVQQQLQRFRLVKVDVTRHGPEAKSLYKRYQIIGPPALVFYAADGQQMTAKMLVGVPDPSDFNEHLKSIL